MPLRTYAEIDLSRMEDNFRAIRRLLSPECRIMSVLKADAYGHGAEGCVSACEPHADWYGVATVGEGVELRKKTDKPILLLGMLNDENLEAALNNRITPNFHSVPYANWLNGRLKEMGKSTDGHIKVDTGLNRTGIYCRPGNLPLEEAKEIFAFSNLNVTGIYTHFSCAGSTDEDDIRFTDDQFTAYKSLCDALERDGYRLGIRHCCNSPATLLNPSMHLDMVRVGALQYGQSFSTQSIIDFGLSPILRWRGTVLLIRDVPAGEGVSYSRIFKTTRPTRIAIVSIGYGDGLRRCISNRASLLIHGRRARIVGKICMDYCMIDITEVENVREGDLVTVIGEDGGNCIYANEIADLYETAGGEVTCAISARVPRVYIRDGKVVSVSGPRI